MKFIYVVTLFLIFFNIFSFMIAWAVPFEYGYGTGSEKYNVSSDEGTTPAETVFENVSGSDYGNILSIFFGDLTSAANILISVAILGGAAFLAWLTRSPAPFVIGFLGNVMLNTYTNSIGIFQQFPINNYLMLAGLLGMLMLFVITSAEYLTHGDA